MSPKHDQSPPIILEQPHTSPPLKEEAVGRHKSVKVKSKRNKVEPSQSVTGLEESVSPSEVSTQMEEGCDRILDDGRGKLYMYL